MITDNGTTPLCRGSPANRHRPMSFSATREAAGSSHGACAMHAAEVDGEPDWWTPPSSLPVPILSPPSLGR
jgi:hypothetical protein